MSLVIIGTGDHARVVLEGLRASGQSPAGFIEPNFREVNRPASLAGLPIIGRLDDDSAWVDPLEPAEFVVALGDNRARLEAFERCLGLGLRPMRMTHPSATILGGAEIGEGTQICAGAVIGVDVRIGANIIINTSASVDHDNVIQDHAFVAPGARLGGRVTVGIGARVGIGAAILQGITIGDWATVAAGAVVVNDVAPTLRVAGVPARPMSHGSAETPEV